MIITVISPWTGSGSYHDPVIPAIFADYPTTTTSGDLGAPGNAGDGPAKQTVVCDAATFAAIQADPKYSASVQVVEE
jgi:hypothetical protein